MVWLRKSRCHTGPSDQQATIVDKRRDRVLRDRVAEKMMRITQRSEYKHTVERSRFFALACAAEDLEQVKAIVDAQKKLYPRARHHAWACRLVEAGGQIVEQARDDGEVGRPGAVLLELLRGDDLYGALLVSRVYGGVKLGAGGVARAFRAAAAAALRTVPKSNAD